MIKITHHTILSVNTGLSVEASSATETFPYHETFRRSYFHRMNALLSSARSIKHCWPVDKMGNDDILARFPRQLGPRSKWMKAFFGQFKWQPRCESAPSNQKEGRTFCVYRPKVTFEPNWACCTCALLVNICRHLWKIWNAVCSTEKF